MVDGLIKLFYSEIVKAKMGNMNTGEYELNRGGREIRNITLKIDSVFLKTIKIALILLFFFTAFRVNRVLALGVLLVSGFYLFYKQKLEVETKKYIAGIKDRDSVEKILVIKEKAKVGMNSLLTLLFIGVIMGFNWVIVISFVIVFVFTVKKIMLK
ncbi:MAG: hypothetical protein LBN09_04885 [Clostridioides sp.]|jgi:hypothetical protein|nr:hypothetical protein [Clostridioides sp.]